jgi:hypothetical protein
LTGTSGDHLIKVVLDLDDINQKSVPIQGWGLQDQLHPVPMGMLAIFRSPVTPYQIMPGAECAPDPETVHDCRPP